MSTDLFDELLKDTAAGRESNPAALAKLQKVHGAESRAADEVAPRALHGRYRYAPGLGWLRWDGRRWVVGAAGEEHARQAVRVFMDRTEKNLRAEIAELEKDLDAVEATVLSRAPRADVEAADADDTGKARAALIGKFATDEEKTRLQALTSELRGARQQADIWLNLLAEAKIGNITKLCRRTDGILTDAAEFDLHHDLLNCHNGVVNLRTGALQAHDPELLITQLAGAAYDPDARCPQWDKAMQAIDDGALNWFQIRLGQAFTGYVPDDDSLTLSDGGGENGKTTVMAGITRAAGTYFTLVSDRVLLSQPGQHPTEMMDFRGARIALLEETPEEGRLDTHQLKVIVGTPKMKARHMRQDTVEWEPTHTLFINTNHLPLVDATDWGTWRRLKRMPWPYKFVKHPTEANHRKGDRTLRPYILSGHDVPAAVLAWVVAGSVKWYAQRADPMDDPQIVAASCKDWRSKSDVGFQFAQEQLIADENGFILGTTLAAEFNAFLKDQGKHEWSAQRINQRMPESMGEAGIILSATADKTAKVRQGDVESRPLNTPLLVPPPAPAGKAVRMWRGVRFRKVAEHAAATGGPRLEMAATVR